MYVPKSRVKTNLYTSGGEYIISSNGKEYKGFYHSLYTGESYTGKTPNDKPTRLLSPLSNLTNPIFEATDTNLPFQYYAENYDGETYNGQIQNPDEVNKYNAINNINVSTVKFTPIQFYPTPTEDDYKLGVFTRYFCVKINENRYFELSKDVYDKLVNKNSNYLWEPYTPFKLQWTIAGELDYVVNTNRNIILLTEKRLKRKGLDIFLRRNYGKFWNSEQ